MVHIFDVVCTVFIKYLFFGEFTKNLPIIVEPDELKSKMLKTSSYNIYIITL